MQNKFAYVKTISDICIVQLMDVTMANREVYSTLPIFFLSKNNLK